jgi:TatD DNase family protein
MLIDTHCHLDHPSLATRLDAVLASAGSAGVGIYVVPGVAPEGWPGIADMASASRDIVPAFGLHPALADRYDESLLKELAHYAERGAAIGEIGLDYADKDVSREKQIAAFRGQLRLAAGLGLPVLLHCRRAFQDLLRVLREERVDRIGGIMHAFSGSPEIARECIGLGLRISISGTVTWRNAVRPLRVVEKIPLEHLVIETDAPDMTPEPFRGKENEPAFLVETARMIAEIKGDDLARVAEITTGNARSILAL